MDTFWVLTLFNFQAFDDERTFLESIAIQDYDSLGVEEFSLSEAEVDSILGDRSYSGGDLPEEVLKELEETILRQPTTLRFFFSDSIKASEFFLYVKKYCLCESQLNEEVAKDWNSEWKKHYSPIVINHQLEIIPSWMEDVSPKSKKRLLIYPGMGFGTGGHETTFLCLKIFTEYLLSSKIDYCLDFGSGSGILGLSVFKFFPDSKIDFYDIDEKANQNCFHNASVNNLESKSFRLLLPPFKDKILSSYDLIFANILEGILIEESNFLTSRLSPGGYLIISGLLNNQVPKVLQTYCELNIQLVTQMTKGDWSALFLRKNIS